MHAMAYSKVEKLEPLQPANCTPYSNSNVHLRKWISMKWVCVTLHIYGVSMMFNIQTRRLLGCVMHCVASYNPLHAVCYSTKTANWHTSRHLSSRHSSGVSEWLQGILFALKLHSKVFWCFCSTFSNDQNTMLAQQPRIGSYQSVSCFHRNFKMAETKDERNGSCLPENCKDVTNEKANDKKELTQQQRERIEENRKRAVLLRQAR